MRSLLAAVGAASPAGLASHMGWQARAASSPPLARRVAGGVDNIVRRWAGRVSGSPPVGRCRPGRRLAAATASVAVGRAAGSPQQSVSVVSSPVSSLHRNGAHMGRRDIEASASASALPGRATRSPRTSSQPGSAAKVCSRAWTGGASGSPPSVTAGRAAGSLQQSSSRRWLAGPLTGSPPLPVCRARHGCPRRKSSSLLAGASSPPPWQSALASSRLGRACSPPSLAGRAGDAPQSGRRGLSARSQGLLVGFAAVGVGPGP